MEGYFVNMSSNELVDTDGGFWEIAGVIVGAVALYGIVREVVKDQGRADAYRDLGIR